MDRAGPALLLAIAVRVALIGAVFITVGDPDAFLTADSAVYLDLARSLTHAAYEVDGVPHLRRPPAYPALLAVGVTLHHPLLFGLAAQVLLGLGTVFLVHRTAARLYDARAAARAALLAALEPVLLVWTATVMAETLLTFCVAGAVYGLVRYRDRPALGPLVGVALAAAGAALTKPIAGALPLVLAALVPCVTALPWRRRLGHAAAVAALGLLPIAAWTLRNAAVADRATFSSQIDGTFAFSAPAAVIAAREGRPFSAVRGERGGHERSTPADMSRLRAEGMAALLSSPRTWAAIHLSGVGRTLLNPGALPYLFLFRRVPGSGPGAPGQTVLDYGVRAGLAEVGHRGGLVLWTTVFLAVVTLTYLALASFGAAVSGRTALLVLAPVAVYFLVLSGGPWGQSRFRHPVMPMVCVLGGRALARGSGTMRPRQ